MKHVGKSVFKADIDPNSDWLSPRFDVSGPAFNQVELQLVSWCNRSCDFCPSGTFDVPKVFMADETIDRIISQLEPRGFSGTIGLHLMCEPLLHKRFAEVVAKFRARLPGTYIRIESNGDVLDNRMERLAGFFDAGLNEVMINCYDSHEQWEARNAALLKMAGEDSSIWYWNRHLKNPDGAKNTWRMIRLREFHDPDITVRNWAGLIGTEDDGLSFPLELSCPRPFRRVHLNYKGEVLLCNTDWKYEWVVGDLMTRDLDEIWGDPVFTEQYRPMLLQCRRDMKPCATCDAGVPALKEPGFPPAEPGAETPGKTKRPWWRP